MAKPRGHSMTADQYLEELELINTREELFKFEDFETIIKALRAFHKNKVHHKKAYLKRQVILQKAKEAGITAD